MKITQNEQNSIDIKGDIKLDFFIFLFPFMRAWEGNLKLDLNVASHVSRFFPTGDMRLENGFIQLNTEIDPFEEVYSDIQLEQRKLIFSVFLCKDGGRGFAGGRGYSLFKRGIHSCKYQRFFFKYTVSVLFRGFTHRVPGGYL